MQVSFFLHPEFLPDSRNPKSWYEQDLVPLHRTGRIGTVESWIYQSWARLRHAGISCELCTEMPQHGIVIVLGGLLDQLYRPPKNVFLVDIVSDNIPHPAAHFYIVQNKVHAERLPDSLFMPHWPQPKLLPRSSGRGSRFENISFYGNRSNLDSELQSVEWSNRLRRELGLHFDLKNPDQWHDYTTTDCVLSIRDFSSSQQIHKPSTKLYNAWLAGVPFIGGRDSSFATEGRPGIDYLVATSPNQVMEHLRRLKEDEIFRSHLVNNGHQSGKSVTQAATLERWKKLLQKTLPERAHAWDKKSPFQRFCFLKKHQLFASMDTCRRKISGISLDV